MFFRETRSKNSKSVVLQLVENIRTDKGPRQRLVVSLGTYFKLPKKDRKPVAKIVQNRFLDQQASLFDDDPIHVAFADKIVKKIQTEGKWESNREQVQAFKRGPVITKNNVHPTAEVFINDVSHGYSRELGPVLIGHTFWERLSFPGILAECGLKPKQIKTAEISVLNRLIVQDSENALLSWIPTVALEELLGIDLTWIGDDRFYRISDSLLKHHSAIEECLYQNEKDLFSLEDSIFLYDLTNTYFEGMCAGIPKAEFSSNQKEKRTDCRQIVVAMMLDGDGFLRGHRVFNGKMTDSKSLELILNELKLEFEDKKMPTIIFDRGVVSEDNLDLLKQYKNLKYVIMCRPNEEAIFEKDFKESEFKYVKDTKSNVEVSLKQTDDVAYLLCKSESRGAKETAMRNRREQKLEEGLKKIAKNINSTRKNGYVEIERRVGRLKERYSSVAKYYEINYSTWTFWYAVEKDVPKRLIKSLKGLHLKAENNEITFNALRKKLESLKKKNPHSGIHVKMTKPELNWNTIDERREYEKTMDGNYLLKTNRTDFEGDEIWKLYTMMTRIEAAFRDLKSYLGLRPNYHQIQKRVEGHIFISILAYHLLHSIEYTLRSKGDRSRWCTVKRLVTTHTYSTIQLPTTNGTVVNVRKPGIPEGIHQEIYKKLHVDLSRLPTTQNLA